jgi:Domain of unknown function (DUF4595) with porin-like fold
MKKLLFSIFAVAAMASCKKEKISDPANPVVTKNIAKVNYVYDNGTPETDEFTFGTDGKIASIKSNDRTHTFNFISAASLEVTERVNTSNAIIAIRYCELNEKGYITKMVVKNAAGTISGTYNYMYNAEGYQTGNKLTYPNGDTWEDVHTYADGNIISVKTYKNNVLNDYTDLTYDNTKANKTRVTNYAEYWDVPGLFGKGAKHMRSELKRYNASGTLTFHIQFTHELDADGYPVKQTNNYVLQGKQGIFTYTFKQ